MKEEPRFPNKFLIAGLAFTIVGGILLLWTGGYLGRVVVLWPVLPIVVGIMLLYLAFLREGPEAYVFLGMLSTLLGVLVLLLNTVMSRVTLGRIWPVFMTITGLSLLVYGRQKRGYARISLTIPGAAIVLLSGVFLPFSLDFVEQEFIEFVGAWWPILIVILGISLLATDMIRRFRSK